MKAFIVEKYKVSGGSRLAEFPEPTVGTHDVLVEVYAAGLNQLDSKIKNGDFKLFLPYKTPFVLGHDVAGVVVKIGEAVSRFRVGDEIYARPADHHIGTFAEFIAINEADAALKPKNITMEEAASIPLVALTAWQSLVEKAQLSKGQSVFIQAGSGGVGTIAIQLAKHLGAKVATTTGTANAEMVSRLGADVVVDYKTEKFENKLSNYDVVLNSQDTKTLHKSLTILKPGGTLISISGPPDPDFATHLKLSWPLRIIISLLSLGVRTKAKRLKLRYSFLFMRADGYQLQEITKLIESGIISPVVDKVFPFDKINDALSYVEGGRAKGKVVVRIKEQGLKTKD